MPESAAPEEMDARDQTPTPDTAQTRVLLAAHLSALSGWSYVWHGIGINSIASRQDRFAADEKKGGIEDNVDTLGGEGS